MKQTEAIGRFIHLLARQTEMIDALTERQSRLQEYVSAKNWEQMEQLVPEMTRISEAIAMAEAERNALFGEISASYGSELTFAHVLARLPEELRRGISERYRALKIAVLRLQSRTATMDAYVRASMATSRGVLQELFPEHASSGYTRRGHGEFSTASAVVVDREL
ncbi:MAG: flagellar export chaperone FlgN [Alkalispirochaeta sp.]